MLSTINFMEKNLKKKKLIMDYGTIRGCYSNIAKMNILEMIYCHIYHWGLIHSIFTYLLDDLKGVLENLFYLVAHLLLVLFLPFSLSVKCYKDIKIAKKEIDGNKRMV